MKNQTIEGVKIMQVNGKVELHIPTGMTGKELAEWKIRNKKAIKTAKA